MCGRYYIDDSDEIEEMQKILHEAKGLYKNVPELAAIKTGEIFPSDTVPIIALNNAKNYVALMKWGYPKYSAPGLIINARAETALEKPLFKDGILLRRCIVPTTGFFEWKHVSGKTKKEKYLIRPTDSPMLYLAGLYNIYVNDNGNTYKSFVILTSSANDSIRPIHDRMPIIIDETEKDMWLNDTQFAKLLLSPKAMKSTNLLSKVISR